MHCALSQDFHEIFVVDTYVEFHAAKARGEALDTPNKGDDFFSAGMQITFMGHAVSC